MSTTNPLSFLANGLGFGSAKGSTSTPKNPAAQFRPPQWSKPAMVMVTAPGGGTAGTGSDVSQFPTSVNGVLTLQETTTLKLPVSYVFDAVLAAEHDQALTKTKHPVQTGAAISSHAYIEPAVLVLYVLMSDVTPQYVGAAQTQAPYIQPWTGTSSKSVSAYQQMIALQAQRTPLTVTTRLRTYTNMLIDRVTPREDDKTITGARFRIEFGQVILGSTQATPVSARPNDTDSTGLGAVNPVPPSATTQQQFGVSPYPPGPSGVTGTQDVPLPPDLHNGTIPAIENGVPGYLQPPSGPYGVVNFVPQYPNSVTAVDVPGAGAYSSTPVQQNGLATTVQP